MLNRAMMKNVYNKLICAAMTDQRINGIETAEYDALTCSSAVCTSHVRPSAFEEMVKIVKPGGVLCFNISLVEKKNYEEKLNELENNGKWRLVQQEKIPFVQAYDKGDIFPIWGECLGLELLSILISGCDLQVGQFDQDLFSDTDAKNLSLKLILPKDYKTTSLWKFAPRQVVKFLQNNNAAFNNHKIGITPQNYVKYRRLNAFFRIVSTSKDRNGVEFISTMEGKRYPVYLLHWHPAKSQFEWRRDMDINHSLADVVSGQYFANFLIQKGGLLYFNISFLEERNYIQKFKELEEAGRWRLLNKEKIPFLLEKQLEECYLYIYKR
ncbi:hypothetical protein pdam_00024014, partial [Pocillopora damicornis]